MYVLCIIIYSILYVETKPKIVLIESNNNRGRRNRDGVNPRSRKHTTNFD